jgi:hypothetical protein
LQASGRRFDPVQLHHFRAIVCTAAIVASAERPIRGGTHASMRKREFKFLLEYESTLQIVIYIVKRIHAEDVTRPTAHHSAPG